MKKLGIITTILFVLLGSGCSFFNRDCTGDDCAEPELLDNEPVNANWYCYGQEDLTWECRNEPDASLIKSIDPRSASNPSTE